jgi:hypothetical protein
LTVGAALQAVAGGPVVTVSTLGLALLTHTSTTVDAPVNPARIEEGCIGDENVNTIVSFVSIVPAVVPFVVSMLTADGTTVKVALTVPPSGFMTVTVPGPGVAEPKTLMVALIWLLVTVGDETVIPGFENDSVAPGWKLLPDIVMGLFVAPTPSEAGATELIVGSGSTVKDAVPTPLSGFVTVSVPDPVVADPEIVIVTVMSFGSMKLALLTVIPGLENVTVAPFWNALPVIEMILFAAPCGSAFGLALVTEGAGPIVTLNARDAVAPAASVATTVTV